MTAPPAWTSLHVFIHDFARLDGFLCDCLASAPPDLLAESFFIRYWLGGPHVRIRFRDAAAAPVLAAHVRDYLDRNPFHSALEPDSYYQQFASQLHTEPERYWHGNGELRYIAYAPEVARYGGLTGLALCERFFVDDSNATLALLRRHTPAEMEKILFGCCLVQYEVLAQAGLFERYLRDCHGIADRADLDGALQVRAGTALARAWPGLLAAGARHATGAYYPATLAQYRNRLARISGALADAGIAGVPGILHALLHMSFNRAGIVPFRENTIRLFALALHNEGIPA
ncbi:thiopeptide-type bacteriocin biosynthesis protein [Pseudoduganella plicata]|nr:thiopeptide-type bacteriocin biosynthesis protein [Pseudoduganella plicata]GGY98857.1 hypothetical protein GCM10007388_35600 [Pseudoduganella plicata]